MQMTKLTYIFGNKNYSSWSLRPWFYLKQNNIEFIEQKISLDLAVPFTNPVLTEYFSDYKVPILVDDGFEVWDTLAIMEYLADKYPEVSSWPKDLKVRAVARAVSAEMHSSFGALRGALPMNCRKFFANYPIAEKVQRDINRVQDVWQYCAQYKTDGDWLFGDFSIADAMFAPIVLRFAGYDVKLNAQALKYVEFVLENKHIKAWIKESKKEEWVIPEDEIDPDYAA